MRRSQAPLERPPPEHQKLWPQGMSVQSDKLASAKGILIILPSAA